jgi:hypothetical protein
MEEKPPDLFYPHTTFLLMTVFWVVASIIRVNRPDDGGSKDL